MAVVRYRWQPTHGITKPPHVWRYDVRDLHFGDLYWLVITCAPNHTQGYQVEHRSEGAFPRAIPMVFVCSLFIFCLVLGRRVNQTRNIVIAPQRSLSRLATSTLEPLSAPRKARLISAAVAGSPLSSRTAGSAFAARAASATCASIDLSSAAESEAAT